MIFFTFDDGNSSDVWAAQTLKDYGLQGIFFLNDIPGLEEHVEKLLDLGMIVGNHTAYHKPVAEMNAERIQTEIIDFNQKLKKLGASGEYFSYPYSTAPYHIPQLFKEFKYIYRGYRDPQPNQYGEISKVAVTNKPEHIILSYDMPLQLHGIETGKWTDISKELFIKLCQSKFAPTT